MNPKTLTVRLGGKEYESAAMTIAEFRKGANLLVEIQRTGAAGNLLGVAGVYEGAAGVIQAALTRAGCTITEQEISDTASPLEIVNAMIFLMTASAWSDPGGKAN